MTGLTDKEILDMELGGVRVRDMTSLTFLQYIAGKINGVAAYKAAAVELAALVASPPIGRKMPDEEKVRNIRRLLDLGVTI